MKRKTTPGLSVAQSIKDCTDYGKNPVKTEDGKYISTYACDPATVDAEFLLWKSRYKAAMGREQKADKDILCYQIRQSFYPGEITPEEANRIGYELAMRWTKGKHQFIVTTHTDTAHIIVALSHHSRLLILDEATSGLDPVVRDDILDMFLDFVQDENNSILVSSHITSDLEKVADYIVFIHNGKVIFNRSKDDLRYKFGIIRCGAAQFDAIDKKDVVAYRKQDYEWEVLVDDKNAAQKKYPKTIIDSATIDEIMLMYIKGER